MKKGEIYRLNELFRNEYLSGYQHPFVYWEDQESGYMGVMLTTSDNPIYKNIELKEEHFKPNFEIGYGKSKNKSKSYIAPLCLVKDVKYEHLKKVGELSEEGIKFIEQQELHYTNWATHMTKKV